MTGQVVRIRDARSRSTEWTDEAVAAACATGDPAAVAELFDRFQLPVTRFLSRMLGASPDVEDLVQTTFLEIARGQARFEGRSAVRTWIFGIAANVARHHFRSLSRRGRLSRALTLDTSATKPAPTPLEQTDARRKLNHVALALEALPIARRTAFVMCELEGLSAREAASALHTTEAAVWKQVSKARKALRKAVEKEES